jgi:hypothetical protein
MSVSFVTFTSLMRRSGRPSTLRPRRLSDRISRTLTRRKDDHRLLVVVLRQGPNEARLGVVRVRIRVAVLVANGRRSQAARYAGSALLSAGRAATATAAGRAARHERVVGDVGGVAQARLLAVVGSVAVIWKRRNMLLFC